MKKPTSKKEEPIRYRVDVILCEVPPGYEELALDHLWTVATYIDVTPPQLAQLVDAGIEADPNASIEVFQQDVKVKAIYRGGWERCLRTVMAATRAA